MKKHKDMTREELNAYNRAYYAANRERLRRLADARKKPPTPEQVAAARAKSKADRDSDVEGARKKEAAMRESRRDKIRAYAKEYYRNNRDKSLAYAKQWNDKNRLKIRAQQNARLAKTRKIRWATDPAFRIGMNTRKRIWHALQRAGIKKNFSSMEALGCSPSFFRAHLESQFTSEFTWENYGKVWEIDHTIPISKFDLNNFEEVKKAFHYTNCQPLRIEVNRSKGDRLDHRFVPSVRMVEQPVIAPTVDVAGGLALVNQPGL